MREGNVLVGKKVGGKIVLWLTLLTVMLLVMSTKAMAKDCSLDGGINEMAGEEPGILKGGNVTKIRVKDVRDSSKISEIMLDSNGNIMGDGDYHIYVWFNPNYMCVQTYSYLQSFWHFFNKIEESYPVTVFVNRGEKSNWWMLQELEIRSEVISKDTVVVDAHDDYELYSSIMQKMSNRFRWDMYSTEFVAFAVSPNALNVGYGPCKPAWDNRSPELVSLMLGGAMANAGRGNWYSAAIEEELTPDKPLTFTDVEKDDWFQPYVKYIVYNGIMAGKVKGDADAITFDPNTNMTRAEFVQALYSKEGKPAVEYTGRFEDVPDGKWYTDAVLWAASKGIVSGTGKEGKIFDVYGYITREQAAAILCNYAGDYKKYDTTGRDSELFEQFADKEKTSSWAVDEIQWALHYNIMKGKKECLDPKGFTTRAECATMLKKFIFTYE